MQRCCARLCFVMCLGAHCLYKIGMSVLLNTLICIIYLFVAIAVRLSVFLATLRLSSVQKNRKERVSNSAAKASVICRP